MEKIQVFIKENDWKKIGVVAYYGYFAINILMKAFAYDHGDYIYKYFFLFAMVFLGIKLVTTRYTLREVIWAAVLAGAGLVLAIITKQNTWLLLFATIIGMKNCRFDMLIKLALYIRVFCLTVLVVGSTFGVFEMGFKTTPNASYVEVPVYSFAMNEPNTAFLSVFLVLMLLIYDNYEKLNLKWFVGTSATALLFYEFTFCRTGIIVFFFCWLLIACEKCVKSKRLKFILALSVPVGALFSVITMVLYNPGNPVMSMMNRFVSSRIYITNCYYKDQGISLIPRTQEFFYASYHGLIDNTYMFVLLYCGVVVALLFFVLVCMTLFKLYKMECYRELIMIAGMALYGVLEQFVMNAFMNPFILLCGMLLYPGLLEVQKPTDEEKEAVVEQEV